MTGQVEESHTADDAGADPPISAGGDTVHSPHVASFPFDNLDADAVLRSSDNVLFHVFRGILTTVSPVFSSMFSLPQPSFSHDGGGAPTIVVTETSDTLDSFLRLSYPLPSPPKFASFDDAKRVLQVMHKFQVAWHSSLLVPALLPHIEKNPLRVYAYALHLGFGELALLAARQTLLLEDLTEWCEELRDISGEEFQRLLVYRKRAVTAVTADMTAFWCPLNKCPKRWTWLVCYTCTKHRSNCHYRSACACPTVAEWFATFWTQLSTVLRATPTPAALKLAAVVTALRNMGAAVNCIRISKLQLKEEIQDPLEP
ncbi:hypothetical protein DICSQDRAFT_178862 [Dichomitus squalens LYAD-421 SS1]|uniref:uncharacterized protein n=1 Tax=Dichomitus squalens (strain LYAD-421) TaxID=732165 RepID=UPI0004411F86|nr:uncharacterized protein DICSQDRAFT_178862 [Dichomitus squalens LYAD-421 SS1]EJF64447.1 hypothetical protein DICSQDRAFT_178862 [Dichomitus squalens LYAD-421 SS1]